MPPSSLRKLRQDPQRMRVPIRRITSDDWRCHRCRKLLGRLKNGVMHLRFERGHEYIVSLPATATCRGCNSLNRIDA